MLTKLKYLFLGIIIAAASTTFAYQISVPAAPGAGYFLTSTPTGVYSASSTNPIYAGYFFATSTTKSSNFRFASSTSISTASLCLTNDTCRTTWPTGGSGSGVGTIATSGPETRGQIGYFSTTNGYPARLKPISTTTVTNGTGITITGSGSLVGGAGLSVALTSNTISGITLGSNLNSLSHDSTLTGTSFNGSAAVSNWGLDLTHANTWTGKQTFTYASTTGISGTYASSTAGYFGALTIGTQAAASGNNCVQIDTTGKLTKTGSACGGAGSSPGGSEGQLQYNHSSAFTGAANLYFINSSGFFGIGTSSPNTAFTVGSSTAINIAEYKYGAGATATSTTMYIGMASSSNQLIRLGTSATTLKISKYHLYAGEHITVTTCTGGAAGSASNAWSNLHYSGGVAPGFTTTANQCDKWFISATAATSSVIATLDGMLPGFQ